jgi:alkylation response protein AidB-like acyl-CoA dehydrogenase
VRRRLYGPDHEAYRETVREFLTREVVPYQHDWDRQHVIDRTVFARAAKAGIYGLQIDERFGGAGEHDYRYRMVVCEELARVFAFSFALTVSLQDDLVPHYLLDHRTRHRPMIRIIMRGRALLRRLRANPPIR